MRTINQILEKDKPHFMDCSFSSLCPPNMNIDKWIKNINEEFNRFIKSICMIINEKTKCDAEFFIIYSNNKIIKNTSYLKNLQELFPHVRLLCCDNIQGNNLILIPRYPDNDKIELVAKIKLID